MVPLLQSGRSLTLHRVARGEPSCMQQVQDSYKPRPLELRFPEVKGHDGCSRGVGRAMCRSFGRQQMPRVAR